MANLKDLRTRISSVRSTQKITRAMQMVAASKLKRAQEAAEAARPYADRMEAMLAALGAAVVDPYSASPLLAGTGREETHLMIVATSERGLCGGFNTNIVRAVRRDIIRHAADGKTVKILCIGRKGAAILRREHSDKIIDVVDLSGVRKLGFEDAERVAARVRDLFEDGAFDVATLYFARFKSALTQIPTAQQLIPVPFPEENAAVDPGNAVYEFEPEEDEILNAMLPRNVAVQIFRGLLENAASEQGARMTAMDSATRNAGEMIDDLTLEYNRTRQAVITNELIEIISGAEAL